MVTNDCQNNLEEHFKGTDIKCYSLQILEAEGLETDEKHAIFAEVEKLMKEHTLLEEVLVDDGELESLAAIKKKWRRRKKLPLYKKRYENVMKQDLKNIYNMTTQVTCIPFISTAL